MNVVLIGMSGSGKSVIGRLLARELSYTFIDVDDLIERKIQMHLQEFIDTFGDEDFIKLEEETIVELNIQRCVIALGGSCIYSQKAIDHLKKDSIIVFLDVSLEVLQSQITEIEKRGIVYLKRKSYDELFEERLPRYHQYSDITVRTDSLKVEQIIEQIKRSVQPHLS